MCRFISTSMNMKLWCRLFLAYPREVLMALQVYSTPSCRSRAYIALHVCRSRKSTLLVDKMHSKHLYIDARDPQLLSNPSLPRDFAFWLYQRKSSYLLARSSSSLFEAILVFIDRSLASKALDGLYSLVSTFFAGLRALKRRRYGTRCQADSIWHDKLWMPLDIPKLTGLRSLCSHEEWDRKSLETMSSV